VQNLQQAPEAADPSVERLRAEFEENVEISRAEIAELTPQLLPTFDALVLEGTLVNGNGPMYHWPGIEEKTTAVVIVDPQTPGAKLKRTLVEKLVTRLLELKASHAHFKVLVATTSFVDWRTGRTYVSKAGLARLTGCSRNTVAAAFDWAEEIKLITDREKITLRAGDERDHFTFHRSILSDYRKAAR